MTQSIPLSDLESSPAAKFANLGDAHRGRITAMDERPQTDITTKAPLTFQDGSPRMQWVITLQKADGEAVALYAKGGKFKATQGSGESMLTAIGMAVREAGATALEIGGELAVAHTGLGEPQPGKAAPKLFTAQYKAPNQSIPADLFDAS